jgi:hypothetical protein
MKMKRTITIEMDRMKVTTSHDQTRLRYCAKCGTESEFITPAEATHFLCFIAALGIAVREENIHTEQLSNGHVLICLNSILNGNHPKF